MRAEHYTFTTEHPAHAAYRRFRQRGWTTSTPWQDQNRTWRITVIFPGM